MSEKADNRLISIIMPAYNEEKFISEAIQSVQKQTYKNWELVIVNDASTDLTGEIIEQLGKKDPRIKLIHFPQNKGVCAALNAALENAAGEYICWLSADDRYESEMLESSIRFLSEHGNFQAVFSRHKFIDERSADIEEWMPGESFHEIGSKGCHEPYYTLVYLGNAFNACTVFATSEAFRKAAPFDPEHPYAGDYDYMLRLAAYSDIGFLDKVNVLSRIHAQQVSNEGKNDIDAILVYEKMLFNDAVRKRLFKKAGVKDDRFHVLNSITTRLMMYEKYNGLAEQDVLEKVLGRVQSQLPPMVQADKYCDKVSGLINLGKWDEAEQMFYSVTDEVRDFIDKEKWGIIAATLLEYQGEYVNEQRILDSVLELNHSNYEAHYMKGHLFERENKSIKALESYVLSVKESQDEPKDHEMLICNLKRFVAEKL